MNKKYREAENLKKGTEKSSGSIHSGHRGRLRDRLLRMNDNDIMPHEMLEAILFYARPRVNTNPIAHELINTFGSIEGVFNANVEELMIADGVGRSTAEYLKLIGKMMNICNAKKAVNVKYEFGSAETTQYLRNLFPDMKREVAYVIGLDKHNYIKNKSIVLKGGFEDVEIDVGEIAKYAMNTSCINLVCVHNHPSGIAKASESDREATEALRAAFKFLKMNLYDSVVVTDNEVYSIMKNEKITVVKVDI